MGGGGSEGKVEFPTYIENFHNELLTDTSSDGTWTDSNVQKTDEALAAAHTSNPYEGGPTAVTTEHIEQTIDNWYRDVKWEWDQLDNLSDWKAALEQGVNEIITQSVLTKLDPHNNLVSNVRTAADSEVDAATTKADAEATSHGIADLDPHTNLVSDARTSTNSEIDAAIAKAQSAAVSSNIANLVSDFENRVNSRLAERKRSVSSLFADVGAVHSSAFLISQALLERDASREVSKFESEQLFQLYKDVLASHAETYIQTFARYLRAEIQNRDIDAGIYEGVLRSHIGTHEQALGRYLQAEIQNKSADDQIVAQGTQSMYQMSRQDFNALISERQTRQQVAATDWEARQSAEEYDLKLDEKAALWELSTLEQAANILSGPAGMSARMPPRSSDTAKAIGGALSGAASGAGAGAAIGAAGGPIGAGVGALIGAGAGAASGFV